MTTELTKPAADLPWLAGPPTTVVGRVGENLVADYLTSLGWSIIDRNWRCRGGELDLVALQPTMGGGGAVCVFVEVKYRTGVGFGRPLDAITAAKLGRMRTAAGAWLAAHEVPAAQIRLDAVGVTKLPGKAPRIEHLRGLV